MDYTIIKLYLEIQKNVQTVYSFIFISTTRELEESINLFNDLRCEFRKSSFLFFFCSIY